MVNKVVDRHICGLDQEGSFNKYVNDLPQHRIGDRDLCPGIQREGSPDVFINNCGAARLRDVNSVSAPEATGSNDTLVNNRLAIRASLPVPPRC